MRDPVSKYLDGAALADALVSGIHRVIGTQDFLNHINVFPVADGDTGTNLTLSLGSALPVLQQQSDEHLGTLLARIADVLLDGSRGNSGAIVAQFFQGISDSAGELARFTPLYVQYLEKAFDRVPRKVIWWAMRKLGIEEWIVRFVQAMYNNTRSRVRVNNTYSDEFGVKVGVHQGSVLSPLLFVIVLEALSCEFRTGTPWELLYADDLVISAETEEGLKMKLNKWKTEMEGQRPKSQHGEKPRSWLAESTFKR